MSRVSDSWAGAFENETATKKPIDEHVQNALIFFQSHESMLKGFAKTTRNTVSDVTSSHHRPLQMVADSFERVLPQDLLGIEHEHLRKTLTVLIFLCDEIYQLKDIAETRFYKPLLMFGQNLPDITGMDETDPVTNGPGKLEKMMGSMLPFLQELSNFIDRCYSVTVNLVQQMTSIMEPRDTLHKTIFKHTHIFSIFYALGDLLSILISLDAVIQENETLQEAWSAYKGIITIARTDPTSFQTDDEQIAKFERLIVSIDQSILAGEIFQGCIEQNFEICYEDEMTAHQINVRNNTLFLNGELMHCMKYMIESSLRVIGTSAERKERLTIVGALGLYALYRRLLPSNQAPDSKLHRVMWSVQKFVPVVVVCETVLWTVGEFLLTHAPLEIKKLDPPVPEAYRRQYIQKYDEQLSQRTTQLVAQSKEWMLLAESHLQGSLRSFEPGSDSGSAVTNETQQKQLNDSLNVYCTLIVKGIAIAHRAMYLAQTCLVMHSSMQVPLTKTNLNDVAQLLELLKALELTFTRKDQVVSEMILHITRQLCIQLFTILDAIKRKLQASRKLDNRQIHVLSVINLCLILLQSSESFSTSRMIALNVMAEIITVSSVCNEKDTQRMITCVANISALSTVTKELQSCFSTGFLYFHTDVLSPIVADLYSQPTEANRLQYLFSAFSDGYRLCEIVLHEDVKIYRDALLQTLIRVLREEIIKPLCSDVEKDLRLHIHTKHLNHMEALNPKTENLQPLRPFLELAPIQILGLYLDVKGEVTYYLNRTFYNLTTVALHDWRTYSDMRSLAAEKLGLILMDNYLPMGSLDQGLDVLQIMRNIHVFVSRFTYNMNMQQFIEYKPDRSSKHLNTIKIQSIAASIRQHGLGVLNTTVNFTYQFLSSKFRIFSQFLFDDYIRAHLSREHRWFRKHKNEPEVNNMYPYERAMKFVKDIRKLGVNENGKSFLDQFRILITEIGNALGYVRMVRSASMFYCSEAVKYLPEFEDIISFEDHSGLGVPVTPQDTVEVPVEARHPVERVPDSGANFSEETVRAAKNLDNVISTLVKNFGEGSDYFKVLVNVFQSVLLTSEHDHLKTFFMIIPALCISWIDASLLAKDALYKTTRGVTKEMYFTDDGFPMGIAYCLAILKQTRKNESLHYIESVNKKIRNDMKELKAQQLRREEKERELKKKREASRKTSFFGFKSKSTQDPIDYEDEYNDQDEVHTLQMTGKKIEAYRRETEQLFYSMSGAEIFFKRTDVDT